MKTIPTQLTLTLDDETIKTLVQILTPAIKQSLRLPPTEEGKKTVAGKPRLLHVFVDGKELPKEESLLVDKHEVSELLQISQRTIWRLLDAGEIPPPIRFGRVVRWSLEGLKKWVDAGCPIDSEWKKTNRKRRKTGRGG